MSFTLKVIEMYKNTLTTRLTFDYRILIPDHNRCSLQALGGSISAEDVAFDTVNTRVSHSLSLR